MTSVVWPLLFTYKGPIIGNGFVSNVDLCGKLLAYPETEGVWLDGVNPGAFAIGASTLDEANRELRGALTRVLVDLAEQADSFPSFKVAVEQFYRENDPDTVRAWDEARAAVRDGSMPLPDGLPRNPMGWLCGVKVTEKSLAELTAHDNPPMAANDQLAAAA